MSEAKKIGINTAYNMLMQVVLFVLPLITTPYISRVLTPDGVGIYNYTNSITNIFILFASFGFAIYGTRQIAYVRENKQELSKTFTSLFFLKIISTLIALAVFICFILLSNNEYKTYYAIQICLLIATLFDISWLYSGVENFKSTALRSLAVKTLSVILIFVSVKTAEDVWVYMLISAGGTLFGNLLLYLGLHKITWFSKPEWKRITVHIKPACVLFISYIAIEIYTVLDKAILGLLTTTEQVAYYSYAEQFAKAALGIIGAFSTVMIPRMSNIQAIGDEERFNRNFNFSLKLIALIGIAASFGIGGIAKEFIPWMLGYDYQDSILLLILLSPLTFIISLSSIIGRTFLVPKKKEKILNISVLAGAGVNLFLNLMLIPQFLAVGACIGTLVAECTVILIQAIYARKSIEVGNLLKSIVRYLIAGIIMLVCVRFLGWLIGASVLTTLVQISVGVLVYVLILIMLRDEIAIRAISMALNRLRKSQKI